MKKVLLLLAVVAMGYGVSNAQSAPIIKTCANYGLVESTISSQEAQGWELSYSSYTAINYLVAPEPPYAAGILSLTFVPSCEPLEPCPEIAKLIRFEMTIINDNGSCKYTKL